MYINSCPITKGFPFEVDFGTDDSDRGVFSNGEVVEELNYFKLEARAGEELIFTIKGFQTDAKGSVIIKDDDVLQFSRSFVVHPRGTKGNRILLLEVEREIPSGDEE